MTDLFVIARNPDEASSLKYLVRLPLEGGLVLKVRDPWPTTARVYCHPFAGPWPDVAEIVEEVPIVICRRRGPAIDLVLDRPRQDRSQFVFTQSRGRSMIFWQTRGVAMKANPGGRVPQRRALTTGFTIYVDSREKYAFRFAGRRDRLVTAQGDEAIEFGLKRLGAGEHGAGEFDRRDLLSSDETA